MKIILPLILIVSVLLFSVSFAQIQLKASNNTCTGAILDGCSGASCILDPDEDGDIVASGTTFPGCTDDEMSSFEALTNNPGSCSCEESWTKIYSVSETFRRFKYRKYLWANGFCRYRKPMTPNMDITLL